MLLCICMCCRPNVRKSSHSSRQQSAMSPHNVSTVKFAPDRTHNDVSKISIPQEKASEDVFEKMTAILSKPNALQDANKRLPISSSLPNVPSVAENNLSPSISSVASHGAERKLPIATSPSNRYVARATREKISIKRFDTEDTGRNVHLRESTLLQTQEIASSSPLRKESQRHTQHHCSMRNGASSVSRLSDISHLLGKDVVPSTHSFPMRRKVSVRTMRPSLSNVSWRRLSSGPVDAQQADPINGNINVTESVPTETKANSDARARESRKVDGASSSHVSCNATDAASKDSRSRMNASAVRGGVETGDDVDTHANTTTNGCSAFETSEIKFALNSEGIDITALDSDSGADTDPTTDEELQLEEEAVAQVQSKSLEHFSQLPAGELPHFV